MRGKVPPGWRRAALGEVLAGTPGGGTPARENSAYWGGPIPWATVKDMRRPVLSDTEESITPAGVAASATRIIPAGSVLLATRMAVGAVAWTKCDTAINQDLKALLPGSELDARFLFQWMLAHRSRLESAGTGTTVKGVSIDFVRGLDLLLPPLDEQRAIAAVLDAVDDTIERTESVIAATEELRRALLHELLTRGVPGMHSEWRDVPGLGTVPACWEVTTLGEAYEVQLGKMLSAKTRVGEYVRPYLTNRNVRWGSFDLTDVPSMHFSETERERFRLESGDLLVCEGGEVGRAAVWQGEVTECYYQKALHRLRPRIPSQVPEFMRFLLEYANLRGWFTDYTGQTSIAHLTREKLLSMRVPAPPEKEQRHATDVLRSVEQARQAGEYRLTQLQATKGALSGALLSGQIRTVGRVAK